ncbi:hypothetical protein KI387_001005, partial [Taxus chinensis]
GVDLGVHDEDIKVGDIGKGLDVIGEDVEDVDGDVGVTRINANVVVLDIINIDIIGVGIGVDVDEVMGMGEASKIGMGAIDVEMMDMGDD